MSDTNDIKEMSETKDTKVTDDTTGWTNHVLDGQAWLRFLFMLLLTPLLGCVGFMVLCVALFQFFSVLATGEDNSQLRALGADLSRLGVDIVTFLTYNTERKPFSMGHPASEDTSARGDHRARRSSRSGGKQSKESSSPRSTATRKKTTRRKKTPGKKKTARKRTSHSGASKQGGSANSSGSNASEDHDTPPTFEE